MHSQAQKRWKMPFQSWVSRLVLVCFFVLFGVFVPLLACVLSFLFFCLASCRLSIHVLLCLGFVFRSNSGAIMPALESRHSAL